MKKKIKIAHVLLSLDIGGLETLVVYMLKKLDKQQFEPVVFCLREKGELAKEIESLDIKVYSLGNKDKLEPLAFFGLAKLFINEKIDVVHCHNTAGYIYGGIASIISGFRKIIYTEHGRVFPDKKIRMMLESILSWFTYKIVAVSKDMKNCLIKYERINPAKIRVIYNGIDTSVFNRLDDAEWKFKKREELGISQNDIVIGNIARLDPVKDHSTLFHSFNILREKIGNFDKDDKKLKLLIVGPGPEENRLKLLCEELKIEYVDLQESNSPQVLDSKSSVIFTGFRSDIKDLINIMDVFVLSSKNEGISLTLLEAMACDVSVVATRVGGNPEIISSDSDGILVEASNPEALAEALLKMITNRTSTNVNSTRINNMFSLDNMTKNYEELYVGK